MKSICEYLYEFCHMEDIKLDFDKSTILNIDGRIFDMIDGHQWSANANAFKIVMARGKKRPRVKSS
jgi:hypothetical protein